MTPEQAKAQQDALEALIAASLLAPNKETEVTDEAIGRYLAQRVTLSVEDATALEGAKRNVQQAVSDILKANRQDDHGGPVRLPRAERGPSAAPTSQRSASEEFIEAVLIAQITRVISSPQYPLGHLRQNKLVYFAHRRADENVGQFFLKKAAGPYSPWATYRGPETIAQKNGYVKKAKVGSFVGFVAGDSINKIDRYLSHYPVCAAVDWVASKLRFKKNEELELLATVDFAALDLIEQGVTITMENVKHLIENDQAWKPKLQCGIFSDANITRALVELQTLFPATYA